MEYIMLSGKSVPELVEKVNQYLLDGWVTQGGVAVCSHPPAENTFLQAMVKDVQDIGT